MTARIQITLPNGIVATTDVGPKSTLKELLLAVGCPLHDVTVYNSGDTPMPNIEQSMEYYNNWYVDKDGFIPALRVKNETTVHAYYR